MIIEKTKIFDKWLRALRDNNALFRINIRIERLENGNMGDVKSVGEGVLELRINYGPGYRIYFTQKEELIMLLLCGGNKKTQLKDIEMAKEIKKCLLKKI